MADLITTGGLPAPEQWRVYSDVCQAIQRARRMREASRAIITGNIALGICVVGMLLTAAHADWGLGNLLAIWGLALGYPATLIASIRWMNRDRARSLVTVADRHEENVRAAMTRPRRTAVIFWVAVIQTIAFTGWTYAFRHMSNAAILFSLALCPAGGVLFFVCRFVLFRFWEDLLFGFAVVLAFGPFLARAQGWDALCFASVPVAAWGTASLYARWMNWSRSLEEMDAGDEGASAGDGVGVGVGVGDGKVKDSVEEIQS